MAPLFGNYSPLSQSLQELASLSTIMYQGLLQDLRDDNRHMLTTVQIDRTEQSQDMRAISNKLTEVLTIFNLATVIPEPDPADGPVGDADPI